MGGDPLVGTDYGRACEMDDYVGLVDVGPGQGLVLGDEPAPTTWWPLPHTGGGILIRWLGAESEEEVITALEQLAEPGWQLTGIMIDVPSGKLVLFDSAYRGNETDRLMRDEHRQALTIDIGVGAYGVETVEYEPDPDTVLLLHRLVPSRI